MKSIKMYNIPILLLNNLNIKNRNPDLKLRIHNHREIHNKLEGKFVYATDMKVKEIYEFWREYFSMSEILEPKESIENILAHVYKLQKVK